MHIQINTDNNTEGIDTLAQLLLHAAFHMRGAKLVTRFWMGTVIATRGEQHTF